MRRYRIGRSETNDIVIPDASVSRQHAECVELGGGRFALSDLASTFGTYVWQDQSWAPAKDTEIRADTVIRFGEFRTTLIDILSEPERAALGLAPAPPASQQPSADAPAPASPAPVAPPSSQPPTGAPKVAAPGPVAPARTTVRSGRPVTPPRSQAIDVTPARAAAARPRGSRADGKKRAMMLGLLAVAGFFAVAAGVIAAVLAFGDPSGPGAGREVRNAAGEGQQKFLAACTTQWGIEERRCRCFLAAAGPHLQPDEYDDFGSLVEAYLSGDAIQVEAVLQQTTEKRGMPAASRLSNAFKGVGRDCPQ